MYSVTLRVEKSPCSRAQEEEGWFYFGPRDASQVQASADRRPFIRDEMTNRPSLYLPSILQQKVAKVSAHRSNSEEGGALTCRSMLHVSAVLQNE